HLCVGSENPRRGVQYSAGAAFCLAAHPPYAQRLESAAILRGAVSPEKHTSVLHLSHRLRRPVRSHPPPPGLEAWQVDELTYCLPPPHARGSEAEMPYGSKGSDAERPAQPSNERPAGQALPDLQ